MSFHRARRQFLHCSMTGAGGMALLNLLRRELDGAPLRPRAAQQISVEKVRTAKIASGNLAVTFRGNSYSPRILSGVESLVHLKDAPDFNAFDPDSVGAAAGLNFEHIISGHSDPANRFTPRYGRYSLFKLPDGKISDPDSQPGGLSVGRFKPSQVHRQSAALHRLGVPL